MLAKYLVGKGHKLPRLFGQIGPAQAHMHDVSFDLNFMQAYFAADDIHGYNSYGGRRKPLHAIIRHGEGIDRVFYPEADAATSAAARCLGSTCNPQDLIGRRFTASLSAAE
jgi:hypothetical protein